MFHVGVSTSYKSDIARYTKVGWSAKKVMSGLPNLQEWAVSHEKIPVGIDNAINYMLSVSERNSETAGNAREKFHKTQTKKSK